MRKKLKKALIFLFFILLIILIIRNTNIVISSTIESANTFFYKVFPSLLPFFVLTDFLINYKVTDYINLITNKFFKRIFNLNSSSAFIILLSMFSGLPSNAKMIKELLDKKIVTNEEAKRILAFTFFPNPMFVIGTIGSLIFNDITIGIKLLFIVYLSNFIIGFILRKSKNNENVNIKDQYKQEKFSIILKTSLNKSFETLLIILGSITVFTILSNLFSIYSPFNSTINASITSIFEMTSGITKISLLNINTKLKIMLISASLGFTGICIISQTSSILSEYNIDFKFIIKCRTFASALNIILSFLLF